MGAENERSVRDVDGTAGASVDDIFLCVIVKK